MTPRLPLGLPDEEQAPRPSSLAALAAAEQSCRRCPLYRHATQAVPGAGPPRAALMLVGEQPGNDEDLQGLPFVGPAGRLLDRALADAGIDRRKAFVTNAVKHFKFEPRGKRRLHKKPDPDEIAACKWWQIQELNLVRPKLVVALGATAARSLLGRAVTISKARGRVQALDDAHLLVTVHPSYLLRLPDAQSKAQEYRRFVHDFDVAVRFLEAA